MKDLLEISIESSKHQVLKIIILISLCVVTSGTETPHRPVVLPFGVHIPWPPKQEKDLGPFEIDSVVCLKVGVD